MTATITETESGLWARHCPRGHCAYNRLPNVGYAAAKVWQRVHNAWHRHLYTKTTGRRR